jgi:hypothetical protein
MQRIQNVPVYTAIEGSIRGEIKNVKRSRHILTAI